VSQGLPSEEWAEKAVDALSFGGWPPEVLRDFLRMLEKRGRTFANFCRNGHFWDKKGSNPLHEFSILSCAPKDGLEAIRGVLQEASRRNVHMRTVVELRKRVRVELAHLPVLPSA